MNKPELGWITEGKIVRVLDGDTVEVEITRTLKIRIDDLRCAESDEYGGQEATEFTNALLHDKNVTIQIMTNNPLKLLDFNSFDRAVGRIWLDETLVRDIIIASGHGKPGKKMGMD